MTKPQIEEWARRVIERVVAKQPNEDAHVELKTEWPPHEKAARRIVGLANAARGHPALWIVGVDEKAATVKGAPKEELANWWPAVEKHFDGHAPAFHDVVFDVDEKTVVALLFDTDSPPYVVKVSGGGEISHEVPWRDGTRLRSARRADLLRVLVPLSQSPHVEAVSGHVTVRGEGDAPWRGTADCGWSGNIDVYVTSLSGKDVIFPYHRSKLELNLPGGGRIIVKPDLSGRSATSQMSRDEVVVHGAGMLRVFIEDKQKVPFSPPGPLRYRLDLGVAGDAPPIVLSGEMPFTKSDNRLVHWGDEPEPVFDVFSV